MKNPNDSWLEINFNGHFSSNALRTDGSFEEYLYTPHIINKDSIEPPFLKLFSSYFRMTIPKKNNHSGVEHHSNIMAIVNDLASKYRKDLIEKLIELDYCFTVDRVELR